MLRCENKSEIRLKLLSQRIYYIFKFILWSTPIVVNGMKGNMRNMILLLRVDEKVLCTLLLKNVVYFNIIKVHSCNKSE